MFSIQSTKYGSLAKRLLKWVFGPLILGIISFAVFNPLLRQFRGVEKYYIYVISDFTEETSKNIRDKFKSGLERPLKIDGVEIVIRDNNDFGDLSKAEKLATDIANRTDTLLIVGHFYSDTTAKALPFYLGAEPPIPVILTTETNPYLLPSSDSKEIIGEKYQPIYALSPDDYRHD